MRTGLLAAVRTGESALSQVFGESLYISHTQNNSSIGYKCWSAKGMLPLELRPAYSVGDLVLQHLDALEQEAKEKGGIQQLLGHHFATVYKVSMPLLPGQSKTVNLFITSQFVVC